MPTENRSSNTEMVSVPRVLLSRVSSPELGMSAKKDRLAAAFEVRELLIRPAPQPHPEPIAWMVGTAIWWTKEEAERDAAATGLPMIPFGPLTGEVEQHPGEPVVLPVCKAKLSMGHDWDQGYADGWRTCLDEIGKLGPLYTRADTGDASKWRNEAHRFNLEVERLTRKCQNADLALKAQTQNCDTLRAQLAERDALLTDIEKRHWSGVDFDLPADLVTRIKALSASAESRAPTWSCQPCQLEQPTDRQCDVCGAPTELIVAKS